MTFPHENFTYGVRDALELAGDECVTQMQRDGIPRHEAKAAFLALASLEFEQWAGPEDANGNAT